MPDGEALISRVLANLLTTGDGTSFGSHHRHRPRPDEGCRGALI